MSQSRLTMLVYKLRHHTIEGTKKLVWSPQGFTGHSTVLSYTSKLLSPSKYKMSCEGLASNLKATVTYYYKPNYGMCDAGGKMININCSLKASCNRMYFTFTTCLLLLRSQPFIKAKRLW